MKFLNAFSLVLIISVFIFSSCTSSETQETSTESITIEPYDTISSANEMPDNKVEEKDDEIPIDKTPVNQGQLKKEITQKQDEDSSEDQIKKETTDKPESVKADIYDFIITNAGKDIADDFKGDLMTLAAEEVYIDKKGKCGTDDCGKKIILVNANPDKSIDVSVEINWKSNDKKINKKRNYKIKGGQKMEIGCSSMCNTEKTKIKWSIIGAVYSE